MCLARERADAALDRVHDLCAKSNTTEGSSYIPLVDEYELVSEFDDLRGVVLRESSDESDDSADSEHSSDDDTASADSDGGNDSDESDGAWRFRTSMCPGSYERRRGPECRSRSPPDHSI